MPEMTGTIANIKLGSFLPGSVNSFDIATVTIREAGTGPTWLFYLWNSRDDAPVLSRILGTQRLALLREAAFRKLTVHIWHEIDSSFIDQLQVDT